MVLNYSNSSCNIFESGCAAEPSSSELFKYLTLIDFEFIKLSSQNLSFRNSVDFEIELFN